MKQREPNLGATARLTENDYSSSQPWPSQRRVSGGLLPSIRMSPTRWVLSMNPRCLLMMRLTVSLTASIRLH